MAVVRGLRLEWGKRLCGGPDITQGWEPPSSLITSEPDDSFARRPPSGLIHETGVLYGCRCGATVATAGAAIPPASRGKTLLQWLA